MAYTYLALGDSYTIGEAVPPHENFPSQLVHKLQSDRIIFEAPTIIAQTGWTTGELIQAIAGQQIKKQFDLVTLLIGVNNQYRGQSIKAYKTEFETLVQTALAFAGNKQSQVIVLSIPDWGVTPFAADRDREKISDEINAFNQVNKKIAESHHLAYVDITPGSRDAATNSSLLAADGLHPSAKEYERWAALLHTLIKDAFNQVKKVR